MNAHRLAERRSLALHRLIASELGRNPGWCERARLRAAGWLRDGTVAEPYARAWLELLEGPVEELQAILCDDGERARALRQATPFAGCIDARRRWRIWREERERWERAG